MPSMSTFGVRIEQYREGSESRPSPVFGVLGHDWCASVQSVRTFDSVCRLKISVLNRSLSPRRCKCSAERPILESSRRGAELRACVVDAVRRARSSLDAVKKDAARHPKEERPRPAWRMKACSRLRARGHSQEHCSRGEGPYLATWLPGAPAVHGCAVRRGGITGVEVAWSEAQRRGAGQCAVSSPQETVRPCP
jgi:hypothetical protein